MSHVTDTSRYFTRMNQSWHTVLYIKLSAVLLELHGAATGGGEGGRGGSAPPLLNTPCVFGISASVLQRMLQCVAWCATVHRNVARGVTPSAFVCASLCFMPISLSRARALLLSLSLTHSLLLSRVRALSLTHAHTHTQSMKFFFIWWLLSTCPLCCLIYRHV